MLVLVAPGARSPVSREPSFRTMRCVVLSVLCHATVSPWLTVAGLGENDWAPRWPMMLMVFAPVAVDGQVIAGMIGGWRRGQGPPRGDAEVQAGGGRMTSTRGASPARHTKQPVGATSMGAACPPAFMTPGESAGPARQIQVNV